MSFRDTRTLRWCRLFPLGIASIFIGFQASQAGEPIQFSSPDRKMDLPSEKEPVLKLPPLDRKWEANPAFEMPLMPQPFILVDPKRDRLRREGREERENWLLQEPDIFKERFKDPFELRRNSSEDSLNPFDQRVKRILGKSLDLKQEEGTARERPSTFFSDEPLFSKSRSEKRDYLGLNDAAGDDRESDQNQTAWSMRSLFEPADSQQTLPLQPGMSLYQMLDAARERSTEREEEREEERRRAFTRLLNPQGPEVRTGGLLDPINADTDLTRTPVNPVVPLERNDRRITPRGPGELLARPEPEALARSLPFEDLTSPNRYQPAARATAEPDKTRQLESLRLMRRSSVLEFPGRRF